LTLAEALVHETQHGKLNTLMWSDPVLRNGATVWTESPVRPDLRPLMGVLLAVHAFVPVALLHRALLEDDDPFCETGHFQRRYLEVLAGNRRGLELLDELADPTPIGQRVLESLRRLHEVSMEGAPPLPDRLREALPPG
jgi:HEXXH motif-containing protein